MKVIRDLKGHFRFRGSSVALGVFDGVHVAHRLILRSAVAKAVATGGRSIAVTFWPHPRGKQTLYSLEHRLKLLSELRIDVCIVIRFDAAFARLSPSQFIKDVLVGKLGCRFVFVGENFRFGRRAEGDVRLLREAGRQYGFRVRALPVIKTGGSPVSSTSIRSLISAGKLTAARRLLGRPVSVMGTVVAGSGFSGKLGFPTADIQAHHEVVPPAGVYAVKVPMRERTFSGVCYIGPKPAFAGRKKDSPHPRFKNIEVYVFGFRGNLYGTNLEVQFIRKIRARMKFKTPRHLLKQVEKDISRTRRFFSLPSSATIYAR